MNAEDAAWLGGTHVSPDDESVQRIFRTHRNDLENLLPFFISGWLYTVSGGPLMLGEVYFAAFLLARYAYSFAYLTQKPRLRRGTYTIGWLVTIVTGVHAAWNAVSMALK